MVTAEGWSRGAEPEETGTVNPLLQPALTGDVEGLQKIFEDPENPHHEQAMQLLLQEDIVGRNLLYAACMAGQSDVIRALAKYGVNLNEKTARGYTLLHCAAAWGRLETLKVLVELGVDIEALNFREERARDVAARYSQTECVEFLNWAGKEARKNTVLNACRVKNEWLETHLEASIKEVFEQKQQLEDIVTPIFTKMATPRFLRAFLKNSEVTVLTILSLFGFLIGQLAYNFVEVLLTGFISFSIAFIIIGYVVLKFNKDSWDLQSCVLFSMTLVITDPVHSVNSLKTIEPLGSSMFLEEKNDDQYLSSFRFPLCEALAQAQVNEMLTDI
ncbi:ankyrin repeat domain-containing protein 45-like protein [Camelus ferus]|nr:ankyrin repeat domain-containing protein 45-like protein [Camelus ferus]